MALTYHRSSYHYIVNTALAITFMAAILSILVPFLQNFDAWELPCPAIIPPEIKFLGAAVFERSTKTARETAIFGRHFVNFSPIASKFFRVGTAMPSYHSTKNQVSRCSRLGVVHQRGTTQTDIQTYKHTL